MRSGVVRLGVGLGMTLGLLACNDSDGSSSTGGLDASIPLFDSGVVADSGTADSAAGDASAAVADPMAGGRLYDKYWAVTGGAEPGTDHPLWASRPDTTSNTRTGADTWRCKECHGWDYKGKDGAYATGSHATGFAGVFGTLMTTDQIVAVLKDPEGHAYGDVLSEQDMASLAAFVTQKLVDIDGYVLADGSFVGDTTAGEAYFDSSCAVCHGADGLLTQVVGGTNPNFEDFPGLIANDNPAEFLHKIRFGQPGTLMPAMDEVAPTEIGNVAAYSQTLPQAPTTP